MTIEVKRLGYALGAGITGVDLAKPISDATIAEIRAAWLEHQVLVFPNADITAEQHIAFSCRFSDLEVGLTKHYRESANPGIVRVTNRVVDGKPSISRNVGRTWHSDSAFALVPPMGSLLHCRALPEVGGDTLFANMYMAYERLSPAFRRVIDPLEVVNDRLAAPELHWTPPEQAAKERIEWPPTVQPIVRVHPETGRKAIYCNETVTVKIHGMTPEESEGLLKHLYAHCVRAEFVYRHRWELLDLVMWDNRCTMHLAPVDYDMSQVRDMSRTTLRGTPTGRVYDRSKEYLE